MAQEKQEGSRVIHVFHNIFPQKAELPPLPPEIPSRPWMYWQMTRAVARKFIRAPLSVHPWAALRRTLLASFLPDNLIMRYKGYQRGECNRCGLCCKILFQCPFFIDEGAYNTRCAIYTTSHVPSACLKFPLDPMDLQLLQREIGNACTFYYEGEPQKLSILVFAKLYTQGVRQQLAKRKLKEAADSAD
jgi:hypothetical protein